MYFGCKWESEHIASRGKIYTGVKGFCGCRPPATTPPVLHGRQVYTGGNQGFPVSMHIPLCRGLTAAGGVS